MIKLKIDVKNSQKEYVLIELEGDMDIYTSKEFKKTLDELIKSQNRRFIVNLEKVTYIDTAGAGILLECLKKTRSKKGDLQLIFSGKSGAWRFFTLTKFEDNFAVYKNKNQAFKAQHLSVLT